MSTNLQNDFFNTSFRPRLNAHVWCFMLNHNETSFASFIAAREAENELWKTAYRGGMEYVREYFRVQRDALEAHTYAKLKEREKTLSEYFEKRITTGDEVFDEFRTLVFNHDWYYEYSDDGGVWRAGNARQKKIEALVKEHGGLYEKYYNFVRDLHFSNKTS